MFPDPSAADAFWNRHRFVPVNHLLTVGPGVAADPARVAEIVRLFHAAQGTAFPRDRAALAPEMHGAIRFMTKQASCRDP